MSLPPSQPPQQGASAASQKNKKAAAAAASAAATEQAGTVTTAVIEALATTTTDLGAGAVTGMGAAVQATAQAGMGGMASLAQSMGAMVLNRGAEWWRGEPAPPLYHVFYHRRDTTAGVLGPFVAPLETIYPEMRDAINVWYPERWNEDGVELPNFAIPQDAYEYETYFFRGKGDPTWTPKRSDPKKILARAERQYAMLISVNDSAAASKIYSHGSRLVAQNDTCMVYEMEGEFDVECRPKVAVRFPFAPTDAPAVDKWMVEVNLRTSALPAFGRLAHLIGSLTKYPYELTKPKAERGGQKFRFYCENEADAVLIFEKHDEIARKSEIMVDALTFEKPVLACLHRFGNIDPSGRIHCRKCGQFMVSAR